MDKQWIPYNQLAKGEYNRPIKRSWVNEIKHNYDEDLPSPAKVSHRDGKYWIIDHQHLTQAQYELNNCNPNTMILCEVYEGLTYEQEAALYVKFNKSQKKPTFAEEFIGLIEAKDEERLRFRDTVESCGYTIGKRANSSLRAIKVTWNIFRKPDGDKELTRILKLTKACWPDSINGADGRIIKGVELFIKNHGDEFDSKRFIKALSAISPSDLIKKAETYYKHMDSKSFTQPYCMYSMLINSYNARLHNKLTPRPPEV